MKNGLSVDNVHLRLITLRENISKIKKRKLLKRLFVAVIAAYQFKFGGFVNHTPDSSVNSKQKIKFADSNNVITSKNNNGSIKNETPQVKIDSGTILVIQNQQNPHPESLKSVLKIQGGDLGKNTGPGARARADARRNAQAGKFSSGSTIIPGADGFVPSTTYCGYHENAPLSCKPKVKVSYSPFQDNGGDNQPPPESSQFDASKYKGGPSAFEEYEYRDTAVVAQNIGFNQPNRLNKSYDKHAEDCFGIVENRNKETLEIFKGEIINLAQSADEVYKGSYRYQDPAYIFLKEINEKMTAVIVNATNGEYITSINPTSGQMENLQSNGNIGLDTRPSMQLTLRLRGPKNNNL